MSNTMEVDLVRQPDVGPAQIEFTHLSEGGCQQVVQAVTKALRFATFHGSEIPSAQQMIALLLRSGASFPHGVMPPLPDLGDHLLLESLRGDGGTTPAFSTELCAHKNAADAIRRMRDGLAAIAVTLERFEETHGLAVSHSPLIELLAWACGFVTEDAEPIAPLGPLEGFAFQLTWTEDHFEYRCIKRVNLLEP